MVPAEIQHHLRAASQSQAAGRLDEADALCRKVLAEHPKNTDALWLASLIARRQGKLEDAANFLRQWLAIVPAKAEPHGILGDIYRNQGKYDLAAQQYQKVIQLAPALSAGHLNLGRALRALRKLPEAIAACQKSIQLKPDWADAHEELGSLLLETGRIDEAQAALSRAVQLKPDRLNAQWNLGKILISQGRNEEALHCYQQAAALNADNAQAHFFLACRLVKASRNEDAAAEFRRAIQLKPDSPDWKFQLAAITGDPTITTAPANYIRDLFDLYAPKFDQHLMEKLHCQIPGLLRENVLRATPRREFDILDLGCGTGLCGVEFKPFAKKLVGVDLSPEMIKRAQARNLYDRLETADLLPALAAIENQFDLILAGDVLVYVGDLSALLPAIARALRPGGLFACSIEDHPGDGFVLHPAQRFAHSLPYFRNQAITAGLKELSATKAPLRQNQQIDVLGWIIVSARHPERRFGDPMDDAL